MTLHIAKKSAILQWFNSLCSNDVASITQLNNGKLFCDVVNSVFGLCFEENVTVNSVEILKDNEPSSIDKLNEVEGTDECTTDKLNEVEGTDECTTDKLNEVEGTDERTTDKLNEVEGTAERNLIAQRYKFLQDFIDGTYHIESKKLITYEECANSNELELAKVAVFLLTSVVKIFLESNNGQVNTLTLLDSKVQEDIQECLSVLLQDVDKLSKEEMEIILCKEAKYKVSPSKRNSLSTPRRCSSKYRKSLAEEEVFSSSPLKSFLESPQFHNQISHAKEQELIKTRKILHAEKIENYTLSDEVTDLRRELQQKDIVILNLQNELKQRKSKGSDEEYHECERCQGLEEKMEQINRIKKEMEEELAILRKENESMQENYEAHIVSLKSILDGRRKCDEDRFEEISRLKTILGFKEKLLLDEQEVQRKLREEIEELKQSHQKDISLLEEKLTDLKLAKKQQLEDGETLNTIMEEDTTHTEEENSKQQIEALQMHLSDLEPHNVIQLENSPAKDLSDVPISELIKEADRSQAKQTSIKFESVEHNSSLQGNDVIDSSSNQVIEQCTAKQTEDVPALVYNETHSPGDGLGSLWANYTDSDSENRKEVYSPNKKEDLAKSGDLLKQLGFSVAEYTSKMNAVKKLCATLKEIFAPNGSNGFIGLQTLGDWEQSIKSDENQLLCLLYIRESLLKFQNNNPDPKDNAFTDKLCDCYSNYTVTLNQLKKEKDDLILKLSESNEIFTIEIQKKKQELEALKKENEDLKAKLSVMTTNYEDAVNSKISETDELCMEIKTTKQLCKAAIANKEKQMKDLNKNIEKLKLELNSMVEKVKTAEENCEKLKEEKAISLKKYNERVKLLKERNLQMDSVKKSLEQGLDYERRKKIKFRTENSQLEAHIKQLISDYKKLEKNFEAEIEKNEELMSKIKELELVAGKKATKAVPKSSATVGGNVKIKEEKGNDTVKSHMPKTEISDSEITANQFSDSLKDVKQEDVSSYSGALFSKHSFILPTDDEESYLNHSSIVEINSEKKHRLQELQRRNSIVPPHMRSSYAPEVQCMSPFNRSLFDLVKHPPLPKSNTNSIKKSLFATKRINPSVLSSAKKKRKVSELESDNSNNGPTNNLPSWKRKMKSDSSFMKILYRVNQDHKPKQQS